jgi:rhamnosyltransferase
MRSLGIRYARGRLLVFLDQDALPADDQWLANLIAPLDNDPAKAAVCSRVLPPPEADWLARRNGWRAARASAERSTRAITDWAPYLELSPDRLQDFVQFHAVSAAIRPEVLRRIPFPDIEVGQELLWAREVLEAGYRIRHEPSSVVCHSPGEGCGEILKRAAEEERTYRQLTGRASTRGDFGAVLIGLVGDDWKYLARACRLGKPELEHWQVVAAMRRTAQVLGQWLGAKTGTLPSEVSPRQSLVERFGNGGLLTSIANGEGL